jgi:hypothetical protein
MTKADPAETAAREKYAELFLAMARLRAFPYPPHGAGGEVLADALAGQDGIRTRLDLAEQVLQESARFRDDIVRLARALTQAADDEFDKKMTGAGRTGRGPEFEGVKDREASARLDTLEDRRKARTAERVADIARTEHERLRTSFYGLRDIRQELLDRLRELQWESGMERG